jgi:hypothetical protein
MKIKLEKTKLTLPVFKLKIKGVFHYFIIDTGCEVTSLASEVIGNRDIKTYGLTNGVGGQEISAAYKVRFQLLGVGIDTVLTSDSLFSRLRTATGLNFSGLVGQDVLKKFKSYTFNNDTQEVIFDERVIIEGK